MADVDTYLAKVRKEFKVRPALPFGVSLNIGSVGVVEDGKFVPRGTTKSILGAPPGRTEKSVGETNWQVQSGRDVSVNFLAKGQTSKLAAAISTAKARVEITLASNKAFLATISKPTYVTLADPHALTSALLDGYQRGVWTEGMVLIYQVVTVQSALILMSNSKDTGVVLEVGAKINPAAIPLADVAAKSTVLFQSQDLVRFDADRGTPLFYNAYRVKKSFWNGAITVQSFAVGGPSPIFVAV